MHISKTSKIAIIGAGRVGSTFAYAASLRNIAAEIVLVDINKNLCRGEVLDLGHGLAHVDSGFIYEGTLKDAAKADIIVIAAGAAQKPGQTRLELARTNTSILKGILKKMGRLNKAAILIIVTNPVDILAYVAQRHCNLPPSHVFGSGTNLDTARFQYLISRHFKVDPRSVNAFIIGEHGDSELAVWSSANIAGVPLKKLPNYSASKMRQCFEHTRGAANEIIRLKGATYYAIGMALVEICTAILKDQNLVLPVSVLMRGHYDINNVCLSVPVVIGRDGAEKIITVPLSATEKRQLKKSATVLKNILRQIKC